ncbi:hypothetical protein D3C80_1657730 [compost metagenome]
MQRSPGLPGLRSDSVLFGFRNVLTPQLLQPARSLRGLVEIEQAGIEYARQRNLAHDHGHDLRPRIEATQNRHEFFALVLADQVNLAQ